MGKDDFDGESLENIEEFEELEDSSDDEISVETIDGPIDAPVYYIRLAYSYDIFYALFRGEPLSRGTVVVVPTRFGRDLATVRGQAGDFQLNNGTARITRIERVATEDDLEHAQRNREKESEAFDVCREMITRHNLPMKLIKVHYLLEESKILFFYTVRDDDRVDFRELVKDLVTAFRTRIELRQIKGRYEFRISPGGMGICGRECCCHILAGNMNAVSIKMAREQNLSLNSMKVFGSCGRLLCCLAYEHNFYSEERKFFPPEGCVLNWDNTEWRVKEINCITGLVTLEAGDDRELLLPRSRFEKHENKSGEPVWKIVK